VRLLAVLTSALLAVALAGCSTRSQRLYHRAEAFLAQGQFKLAADEYERLVAENPRDPLGDDALYKVAYIYAEEMDKPALALTRYRQLADRYPSSSYADDALMRIASIQRAVLHDPEAVKQTCEEISHRFSGRAQLRARAALEVARAQFDCEQYKQAAASANHLMEQFPEQTRQCAQAAFLVARATESMGGDPGKAADLYRKVVAEYPDTHSAALAKSRAGWLLFGVSEQEKQQQQEEQKRKSRIIQGVPAHGAGADTGQLQALSVLRSALAHRGEARTLDELVALSGVAFQFVFDPAQPTLGMGIFPDNPFETVAGRLGFACNVWSSPGAEQAFASVHQALLQGHPVIVLYDAAPSKWLLVTGYEVADGRVHFLPPGQDSYATESRETFLARWASSSREGTALPAPGQFYQFSLGARPRTPPEQTVVSETLQRAADIMGRRELSGVLAGQAAYEKLAQHLEQCAAADAGVRRQQALAWAQHALPACTSAREAGTAYLRHAAEVRSGAAGRLGELARRHAELVAETRLLRKNIQEAAAHQDQAGDRWQAASAQVRYVAALETRIAEQLSAVLQTLSAGGG
jgi:outer membrane protein assembly factor BamD (BamD/ComL family)